MSHIYPLGKTARAALQSATTAARTRYEAEGLSDGLAVLSLETEWITPAAEDLAKLLQQAEDNPGRGFVQHYEDASGNTVLAVTYWKIGAVKKKTTPKTSRPSPKPADDHTDDLYFRSGRTRKRRAKPVDPNQFDLFGDTEKPDP